MKFTKYETINNPPGWDPDAARVFIEAIEGAFEPACRAAFQVVETTSVVVRYRPELGRSTHFRVPSERPEKGSVSAGAADPLSTTAG